MDPESQNELFATRRAKLDAIRALGVDPFGGRFDTSGSITEIRARFAEGNLESAAGRLTAHRDMGRSHFLDLNDGTDRIQLFLSTKELPPEQVELFKLVDLADFIGVQGQCFLTKTGEPSIRVKSITLLSKALRPLPSSWYGLADVEQRYRQRYVDLLVNPSSRDLFLQRIQVVREIRDFLHARGFLEVETPMMQAVAGGAAALPFKTHHNALNLDLYLRIAPELYLKRLLVGGFTKIFELNRNFRNEGISRRHNPEFTMLEAYWAFADFRLMADLVEELICHLAQCIRGSLLIEHKDAEGNVIRSIDLTRPWRRAPYRELVSDAAGQDWFDLTPEARRQRASELGVEVSAAAADFEVTQHVFESRRRLLIPSLSPTARGSWFPWPGKAPRTPPPWMFTSSSSTARRFRPVIPSSTTPSSSASAWSIRPGRNSRTSTKIFSRRLSTACLRPGESASGSTAW